MIESSMMINDRMPEYCVGRAMRLLNRDRKAINGAKVLVLGVAYKQDIDDYRESPAIRVIDELQKVGAEVRYFDPYIPSYQEGGKVVRGEMELSVESLRNADLVMITCAHTNINYNFVQQNARRIFDTKNAMKNVERRENIEVL